MSETSEGVKPEPSEASTDVKDTTLLTNIPMDDTIDLQHAVVIMPENSDGNLAINTIHEGNNVVVVASVTSNGELITPDILPEQSQPEQVEEVPEKEPPKDPNTCTHCNKVFRSQTVGFFISVRFNCFNFIVF